MGAPDSPPHVQRAQGARTQGAPRRSEVPRWAQGTLGNGDKRLTIALTAGETLLRRKVDGAMMHVFCAYDESRGCVHTAGGCCNRGVVQRVRKIRGASATATCNKGAIL
jgi:hypothetical protein